MAGKDIPADVKSLRLQLENDARKTAKDKGSREWLELGMWPEYMNESPARAALYCSFSDEELKDILRRAAERLGRLPYKRDIFCIYQAFIIQRFGNWPWALIAAGLKEPREVRRVRNRKIMKQKKIETEQRKQQKRKNGGAKQKEEKGAGAV